MISKTGSLNSYAVMVTGACGFLGRKLVPALLSNGASVVGIDSCSRLPESFDDIKEHRSFSFVSGCLTKKSDDAANKLLATGKKRTAVFHMAGMSDIRQCNDNPYDAFKSNVLLTMLVLELCRQHKISRFVFPSTGLVYGESLQRAAVEKNRTFPGNVYSATKLSSESMIRAYGSQFGLSCMIVRLSNVYGPGGNADTVVGTVAKQIISGGRISLKDFTPVRDFIYIEDVIEGLLRLLLARRGSHKCHVVNLSTGTGTSIRKMAETACRAASVPADTIRQQKGPGHPGSRLVLSNRTLIDMTGWKPRYALSEGLLLLLKGMYSDHERR